MRKIPPLTLSVLAGASLMLSLAMGMRQSLGLFLPPITRDLGISAADFTLAIAIQNLAWGCRSPSSARSRTASAFAG